MKRSYLLLIALFSIVLMPTHAHADLWYPTGNYLTPVNAIWGLKVPGIAGGAGCLGRDASGVITSNGSSCGGSGSPGGSSGQIQYNAAGAFGGVATTTLINGTNITFSGGTPVIIGSSPITINASGGGGTGLATSSPVASSNVLTYSSVGAGSAYGTATSTPTAGTGIAYSGTLGSFVGGASGTLTATLGTNITPDELNNAGSANSLLYTNSTGSLFKSVATSTITAGTGLSSSGTAGYLVDGTPFTISFNNALTSGGTGTTSFYNKGLVFSDGSMLTQAAGSGASILNWDNTNGRLGIGTTTPAYPLSVIGNSWLGGDTTHLGSTTCGNGGLYPSGSTMLQGFEFCGLDNSDAGGVQGIIDNNSSGANAWGGLTINNALADPSLTHFFGVYYNSPNYTSTAFGTALGQKNLAIIQNTDGMLALISSTSSEQFNRGGIALYTGGTNSGVEGNERLTVAVNGTVGIGSSTPHAQLSINAGSASPTRNLIEASYSTGVTNNATTTVFSVASSTGTAVNIATSSAIGSNVLTVNGGVYFHGLATGAGNGALCATTDGLVSYDAGANCIVSSLRFKNVDATITPEESIATVLKLSPIFFHYKQGYGDNGKAQQEGFGAESVALVDTNLVQYDASNTPFSVFYQNITAKLVGAVQAIWNRLDSQQQEIDQLKAQVKALQDAQQRPLPKSI